MASDDFFARHRRVQVGLSRLNAGVFRLTRGRAGAKFEGLPVILLTTTGRKSGKSRTTPVVYMPDGDRYIVVGTASGSERPPAWALNLEAAPDGEIQVGGTRTGVRAHKVTGAEREQLWERLVAYNPAMDRYAAKMSREAPVLILEPRA